MEEDNPWRKYLFRSNGVARIILGAALTLLRPEDLLFFGHGGRHIAQAGIYLGDGKMIHASSHRRGVIISDLRQLFYEGDFVVARRLFELQYPKLVSIRKPLPILPFGNQPLPTSKGTD